MELEIQEKKEVQRGPGMAVENGVYALNSVSEQMTYAQWLIDKRLVSETFKNAAQLVVAIQLCKDLDLPNSALSCFYVVGNKPAIFGDVLIGLVMGSGLIEGKRVSFFDESGELILRPKKGQSIFGCEVYYKRKGYNLEVGAFYTMDDKDTSRTTNGVWSKHPTDMLWRRADVRAIKMIAPDAIKGIEVVEYLEDKDIILTKATKSTDASDKARMLTETFSQEVVSDS